MSHTKIAFPSSKNSFSSGSRQLEEIGTVINDTVDKSQADDCERIKGLGYSSSRHIQMYGERFDIVSDPFPAGTGVAVHVTTALEPEKRVLRLPTSLLVGFEDMFKKVKRDTSSAETVPATRAMRASR